MVKHPPTPPPILIAFWLANLAFLLRFADRDGYEGDDLNSILPMAHLTAAKQGLLLIYRYAWQPLSYELGALIWRIFGKPEAVFLMAPVAGAATLGLLLWWLWREGRSPVPLGTALIALLAIPELWYSSLYYNSTILGMPLLATALLLIRGQGGIAHMLGAGVLTGLAILMRIDFILICPLLAVAAWSQSGRPSRPIVVAVGVVTTLAITAAIGLLDLQEVVRIQTMSAAEIRDKAALPGWDLRTKIFVLTIALSPVGWIMLAVGLPATFVNAARRRDGRLLIWGIAALPAAYPLFSLLSPKYVLPVAPFLLLLFVRVQEQATTWLIDRWRILLRGGLLIAAVTPIFLSISLSGKAPFLLPGLEPSRPIGTHDGPRGYGGYLWQLMATDSSSKQSDAQYAAADLARNLLEGPHRNILLVGGENYFDRGGIAWRHLQLILARRGIHGVLVAPHVLLFDLGTGRRLILARKPLAMEGNDYVVDLSGSDGNAL